MNKKFKKIVMILSVLSLTLASTHLAIKADNAENAGGGHEATSVTAEATDTTTVTTEDVLTGVLPVSAPVDASVWEAKDFIIEDGDATVAGFSEDGIKKAKAMTEESVLTFPETVTKINQDAFIYSKYENELSNGIVGKVRFHGGITYVGNSAFQGNPEINEVIVEDGESILFGIDAFNPAKKLVNVGKTNYKNNESFFEDVPVSKLSKLTIGSTKFVAYARSFARNNIEVLDFGNVKVGGNHAQLEEFSFFGSSISEISNWGDINYINHGAFANCNITRLNIPKKMRYILNNAFRYNTKLTSLTFEPREDGDPGLEIHGSAFFETALSDTIEFPNVPIKTYAGDTNSPLAAFGNKVLIGWQSKEVRTKTRIKKVIGSDKGMAIASGLFNENPIETVEKLNPYEHFEGQAFADTEALKNVSFVEYDKFVNTTDFDYIQGRMFANGKLKSVELPAHFTKIAGDAYEKNTGWIDGETKVALYRKDANGYVTDNAVADGKSFVINPVLVNFEAVNQYGNPLQSELKLTTKVTRGVDVTENVEVNKTGNHANFKLGDTFNITGTDGLTLIQVDGKDYSADTEITVDPALTTEVSYGDGYKVGYRKFTLKLKVKDPKAVNPAIYDPIIIPSDPVTPATPDTSDTTVNPVNPENPVNPVNPTNPVTPVTPATEPTVTNPVEPVTQPDVEDVEEVELPSPEDSVEEDIEVEGDETPQGSKKIEEAAEEDLNIEGDEIPQGSTNLSGKKNSKVTAKTGAKAKVTKTLLAKTGGQNVMIYQVAGIFAVLLLGYGLVELTARKKREEK